MESYNGTEQRLQLRIHPHKQIEYQVLVDGHMANQLDALLWGWQGRVFAVPVWRDGLFLNQQILKGSQSIPVQSLYYDFKENGLLILYHNENHYEVLEIKQITDQNIIVKRPTQQNWPAGTTIYLVVLARLPQQTTLTRITDKLTRMHPALYFVEPEKHEALSGGVIFEDISVFTLPSERSQDMPENWQRKLEQLDFKAGLVFVEDLSKKPAIIKQYRWLIDSHQDIDAFITFLYARAGRLHPVWLPSWQQDITISAAMGKQERNMRILDIGYRRYYQTTLGRQVLCFLNHDRTLVFRRIITSSAGKPGEEIIALDQPFGKIIMPDSFLMISFMSLYRLESDAVEIVWITDQLVQVSLQFRLITQ